MVSGRKITVIQHIYENISNENDYGGISSDSKRPLGTIFCKKVSSSVLLARFLSPGTEISVNLLQTIEGRRYRNQCRILTSNRQGDTVLTKLYVFISSIHSLDLYFRFRIEDVTIVSARGISVQSHYFVFTHREEKQGTVGWLACELSIRCSHI